MTDRQHTHTNKIKQVTDRYLSSATRKKEDASVRGAEFLNQSVFTASLFSKASTSFIEHKSLEELVHIADGAVKTVEEYINRTEPVIVKVEERPDSLALYIVLTDRPFIINTVTETIRAAGADIRTFLHPIFKGPALKAVPGSTDSLLSFSYLELDVPSSEQTKDFVKNLIESLRILLHVTDDFAAMLVRVDTLTRLIENPRYPISIPQTDKREIVEFLRLLSDGGFVFIGYADWRLGNEKVLPPTPSTVLGFLRSTDAVVLNECRADAERTITDSAPISITRMQSKSRVHRHSQLLSITVLELSNDGRELAVHSIIGMLTSRARSLESSQVPLIRRKLQRIIDLEEALPNSYIYKSVVNLIDHMPKEDALRLDVTRLHEAVESVLHIHSQSATNIAVLVDEAARGASVLIAMPRDRFTTDMRRTLQRKVEETFEAPKDSSEYLLDVSDKLVARFYFSVPSTPEKVASLDVEKFKNALTILTKTWKDAVEEQLLKICPDGTGHLLFRNYQDAFGDDYQALQTVEDAITDIQAIELLRAGGPDIKIGLSRAENGNDVIIVYHKGSELTISKALPVLENAGLEVIHERSSTAQPAAQSPVFIHRFIVKPKAGFTVTEDLFSRTLAPGLTSIFLGQSANDPLNLLMLAAELEVKALSLLRTYAGLLSQINKFATRHSIFHALATTPAAAQKLWQIFETKFNPELKKSLDSRRLVTASLIGDFRDILNAVTDLSQDRILRGLGDLLEHTVRTNFYSNHPAIALKIHSEATEILPQPRPKYEIFVSSAVVEGIHLRSSMVARGGLRWSDRKDDYRTEVLGLMKTQKTKNAVIVPSGAKGGFIVRLLPDDPTKVKSAVEAAYREFIRALLSVTDNRTENGDIVHPENLVIYDAPDPYLVVAADKGTATFSDIANKVAVDEFNFWLGDAFASGGSNGYDHKAYAITAKGVWECVQRHFKEAGINYVTEPFTVIGIGDMSGDVFGNGLLLSDNMKLVAAFDHRSIFVDPNPDSKLSYAERKRLFEMKGSKWDDYSKSLISDGGGVWGRFDKEIVLSPHARQALSLSDEVPESLNGEQLMSHILRAKVDLFWNGGIGTYVKSAYESNPDVNDSANDRVRVNADELRATVVGEGGNLGFTQSARVDFAKKGGFINTDAIDNSGGVDLSDHEVNLKLLFASLMAAGRVTREERNVLLKQMGSEVVESVLVHNRSHALTLTLAVTRSRRNIDYLKSLMKDMSRLGYLQRSLEFLPDDEELAERATRGEGLLRPELAVLLAVVKMWTKDALLNSEVIKDPALDTHLKNYFPETIQNRYGADIVLHPLAKNITAAQVTNEIVDDVGISFFHRMVMNQGVSPGGVIKCAIAADSILDLPSLRRAAAYFDTLEDNEHFLALHQEVTRTLRAAAGWLVSTHGDSMTLSELVALYKDPYRVIAVKGQSILGKTQKGILSGGFTRFSTLKLEEESTFMLASFPLIIPILEMLQTSRTSKREATLVARVYSLALDALGANQFVTLGQAIETHNRWENELRINAYEEIRRSVSLIVCALLEKGITDPQDIQNVIVSSPSFEQLRNTLNEIKETGTVPAALSVVAKQLRLFRVVVS